MLRCSACSDGFPIDDELLMLTVPGLMPQASVERFFDKFAMPIERCGLKPPVSSDSDSYAAQLEQREHFDWFADNENFDYFDYALRPMWKSADVLAFARWKRMLPRDAWLLDVGCANGRATFPMTANSVTAIGMDVSEKMLRQAIVRSLQNGTHAQTSFLLADGNALPFVDGAFDRVMTYGVLHHLPDPAKSCREFQRVLARGGIYLGSENHESPLRPLFDLSMKILPLWQEKAGAEPMISATKLREWHDDVPVDIETRYCVFLPPHAFNAMGSKLAYACMSASDWVFNALPWIRKAGGLIVYEIHAKNV